jgi:hypothetical protein
LCGFCCVRTLVACWMLFCLGWMGWGGGIDGGIGLVGYEWGRFGILAGFFDVVGRGLGGDLGEGGYEKDEMMCYDCDE